VDFVSGLLDAAQRAVRGGMQSTILDQELPQFPHDGVRRGPMLGRLVGRGVCCRADSGSGEYHDMSRFR
jgi:hypothetical protein